MRCKACDVVMDDTDMVINPHSGYLDELCRKCRDIVHEDDEFETWYAELLPTLREEYDD